MIKFDAVTTENLSDVSFEIKQGALCAIVTETDAEREDAFKVMVGLRKPRSGAALIFGKDASALAQEARVSLFARIGVVTKEGGTISNLKAWENLMLPVSYHARLPLAEAEAKAVELFGEIGLAPDYLAEMMEKAPGALSPQEKTLLCLVRAALEEPETMIYDGATEGLKQRTAKRIIDLAARRHRGAAGRTSVFLTSSEASLCDLRPDQTIRLGERE